MPFQESETVELKAIVVEDIKKVFAIRPIRLLKSCAVSTGATIQR